MPLYDELLAIGILLFLFLIIYTRMKNQSLKDTWDELMSIFESVEEVPDYYVR